MNSSYSVEIPSFALTLLACLVTACGSGDLEKHKPVVPLTPPESSASRTAASPAAAPRTAEKAPDDAVMMRVVFGKSYRTKSGTALAVMPDVVKRGQKDAYLVEPLLNKVLPSGHALLLTNSEAVDENGEAQSGHSSPGLMSLFVLEKKHGRWRVAERHENMEALGSHGHIGTPAWVDLGHGRVGLAVEHGGAWQGYSITHLSLYDVTPGRVRALTEPFITLSSDNEGACEEPPRCWNVSGAMRLLPGADATAYPDLEIAFKGVLPSGEAAAEASANEASAPRETEPGRTVSEKAVYRFDGKAYRLIRGSNPVPGI